MRITGLDLSLSSTGVARVVDGHATVDRVLSKPTPGATLLARQQRLHGIAARACAVARLSDLVVVEAPSYGSSVGAKHDRSGLWWLIVNHLIRHRVPVAEVAPAGRAKYATGKGNAGKDAVLAAVVKRYADVEVDGNDAADALVLAAMGARHLGAPIEHELPKASLAAMDSVRWPEMVSDR